MKHDAATLEKIIRSADSDKCFDFFIGSSSEERAGVRMLVEEITPWVIQQDKESTHAMIHSKPGGTATDRRLTIKRCRVLGLCVLATGSLPQMKKLDFGFDPFHQPELLCKVLKHLQVPWLNDWVEHLAKNRRQNHYQFLIEAGLARMPEKEGDAYVLGFLGFGRHSRLEKYGNDENFLKVVVWKFFEVEGDGDRSLSSADKYCGKPELTWAYALKELSDQKKLSRDRLLDASLEALARDFPQYRSSWYSRFHEYLEPTLEERIKRTDLYLKLLASSIPPTVSFALNALKVIHVAGKLAVSDLPSHLSPVLLAKSKGTVLTAVALLEDICAHDVPSRPAALRLVIEGLVSGHIQVQEQIVKMLGKYPEQLDSETSARLGELLEMVSPSCRKKIVALSSKIKSTTPSVAVATGPEIAGGSPPSPSRPVEPIASQEELIEKASYLLENFGDLIEMERVLDGLVRLSKQSADREAQALLKRARKINESKPPGLWTLEKDGLRIMALLISSWIEPRDKETLLKTIAGGKGVIEFLAAKDHNKAFQIFSLRLNAILKQILQKLDNPLLSTPTHQNFQIDPRVLIPRVSAWQKSKIAPDDFDVIIALLRLDFEHRSEALKGASSLSGELGQVVRYALGADEKIGKMLPLWIAASRSRYRGALDPVLKKRDPKLGIGAYEAPPLQAHPKVGEEIMKSFKKEISFMRYDLFRILAKPSPPDVPLTQVPVVLHSDDLLFGRRWGKHSRHDYSLEAYTIRFYLSIWPTWKEPMYGNGALCLGNRTHWFEVGDHASFVLLDALADPVEEFRENARLLLNFGLSCPHADGRTSAANAFIVAINTDRLDPRLLGQSLLPFFTSRLIHPARIRKSLDEVIRVSPKHRRAVLDYLHELMRGDPTQAPDNTANLLELFYELLVEHDEHIGDAEVLAYLKGFSKGGRAAKLAKQIIALS